jgi:hypothetical protein
LHNSRCQQAHCGLLKKGGGKGIEKKVKPESSLAFSLYWKTRQAKDSFRKMSVNQIDLIILS